MWQEGEETRCRACATALTGPYCSECGQRRAERLGVRRLLGDLVSHVASLDSGLVRTVVGMTVRPGRLIRRYIGGDRTTPINPGKYAFLAATLYTLAVTLLDVDVRPAAGRSDDPRAIATMRLVVQSLGYLLFLYLVPAAWLLSRTFRRWRLNLAEAYAGLLFYAGQYMLVVTVLVVAGAYATPWGFWVARSLGLALLLWVIADWFRGGVLRTVLGGVAVWVAITVGGFVAGMALALGALLLGK